nr:hypothetical protein [Tanacetum cinerariifolium]
TQWLLLFAGNCSGGDGESWVMEMGEKKAKKDRESGQKKGRRESQVNSAYAQ